MSEWNFNMDEAPKGHYETQETVLKGKTVTREVHIPEKFIAAGKCGVVTISRWLPKQNMWNMFGEKETPIAWQPWPEHPEVKS